MYFFGVACPSPLRYQRFQALVAVPPSYSRDKAIPFDPPVEHWGSGQKPDSSFTRLGPGRIGMCPSSLQPQVFPRSHPVAVHNNQLTDLFTKYGIQDKQIDHGIRVNIQLNHCHFCIPFPLKYLIFICFIKPFTSGCIGSFKAQSSCLGTSAPNFSWYLCKAHP